MESNRTFTNPAESFRIGSGVKSISPTAFYCTAWVLFALCTILFAARAYIRFVCFRRLMCEDYLMLLSLAMHNGETVLIQVYARYAFDWEAVDGGDMSRMTPDFIPNSHKGLIAFGTCIDMSMVGILIVKLTFLLFFRRIYANTGRRFYILWWGVVLFTITGAVAALAILAHHCVYGPVDYIFNSAACNSAEAIRKTMITSIFSAVQDVFSDFLIIGFPVAILWRSGIGMRNKLILSFVFGMVSFTIAITIVRGAVITNILIKETPGHHRQQTATFIWFWLYIEYSVAIIIACIVSFRTLFVNRDQKAENRIQEDNRRQAFLESRARRRSQNKVRQLQSSVLDTCRDLEGSNWVDRQPGTLAMDVPSGLMTVDFNDDTSWTKTVPTVKTNGSNNSVSFGRSISMQRLIKDQVARPGSNPQT